MKIIIHDLLRGKSKPYEGDVITIERELDRDFPWATEHNTGDLDSILWTIDHHSFFMVEVLSKSLHPFYDTERVHDD